MRKLSTAQVAKKLGLQRPNFLRAIRQGKVKAPPLVKVGPLTIRLWSKQDVERARKALGKQKTRVKS